MNTIIPINDSVYWIGANDRTTNLFESLWPLPRGVSYNAYIIKDDKTALIDTVKNISCVSYVSKIQELLGENGKIDYLIINHMEPDHSGSIKTIVDFYPDIKIIGNKKTLEFLKDFYGVTDNFTVIDDNSELDLGKHKLKFFMTPMVHWPETLMTYDQTDKILFSGDAFGGFGALDGGIFDDEVDIEYFEDEILRYFSNIVGKFSSMVQKAIIKLNNLDIKTIASTHGPVWRKNPQTIIEMYDKWSKHEAEDGVVIVYGSMYGNTEKMMEAVTLGLREENITKIRIHNISNTHISFIIRDIWRYKAVIFGAPTYNTNLFPPMEFLVKTMENSLLKNRTLGLFGTYTWSGGGVKALSEFTQRVKWNLIEPVIEAKCSPTNNDINNCTVLGRNIAKSIKNQE